MATLPFKTVKRKTAPPTTQNTLIQQLDELQRINDDARRDCMGHDWFKQIKDFYLLRDTQQGTPSFRPRVNIPELQVLMLQEASDLADLNIRVYIEAQGERQKEREKAFQQQWRQGYFNNQIMMNTVYGLFHGVGFTQIVLDPRNVRGQSQIGLRARDPETVWPDAGAKNCDEWMNVQWEDEMYSEQIAMRWPGARGIKPSGKRPTVQSPTGGAGMGFQLPAGPLTVSGYSLGENSQGGVPSDKMRVRTSFIYDDTRERVKAKAGEDVPTDAIVPPEFVMKYPDGRMIVDVEGIVLFDGNNPWPRRMFPIVPMPMLPPLYGFYPPSPLRYSRPLQELGGRMLTQVYENAVRLNNGVWFIPESTGIDREDFGGVPGEVHMINQNSERLPECKYPDPMPQQFIDLPEYLFSKARLLQGFTPTRSGDGMKGNIGAGLADASILNSQYLTRMRAKFMSEAVQRISEIVYYGMIAFYSTDRSWPMFAEESGDDNGVKIVKWDAVDPTDVESEIQTSSITLDPGAIRPMSQSALQQLVLALRDKGMIDTKSALEILGIPGAAEMAENMEHEQELAALSRITKSRR